MTERPQNLNKNKGESCEECKFSRLWCKEGHNRTALFYIQIIEVSFDLNKVNGKPLGRALFLRNTSCFRFFDFQTKHFEAETGVPLTQPQLGGGESEVNKHAKKQILRKHRVARCSKASKKGFIVNKMSKRRGSTVPLARHAKRRPQSFNSNRICKVSNGVRLFSIP